MMKRTYRQPTMRVVSIKHTRIICGSGDWGVIGPGQPNQPAGVKEQTNYNVWDDDWSEE